MLYHYLHYVCNCTKLTRPHIIILTYMLNVHTKIVENNPPPFLW